MNIEFKNCIPDLNSELDLAYTIDEWNNKYIIIYGINPVSIVEYSYFVKKKLNVQAFIDFSVNNQGKIVKDRLVYSPESLLSKHRSNAVIITNNNKRLNNLLSNLGYSSEQIINLKSLENNYFDAKAITNGYSEMSLRDIQLASLEVLKRVKAVCDSKGIKYFLAYGSLLGAVRHKGFIPWDDDIDIVMPWEDYIRFCKEFPNDEDFEIFTLYKENNMQPKCIYAFSKIMNKHTQSEAFGFPLHMKRGICVDVFPMNGFPDNEKEMLLYSDELTRVFRYWNRVVNTNIGIDSFSEEEFSKAKLVYHEKMTRYSYNESKYVGNVACGPFERIIAPIQKYGNPSKVIFENIEFNAPADVDYILKITYGNYMQLPPIEQRQPKHLGKAYYIN